VVFSIKRAQSEDSDMKELLTSIVEVRAPDPRTVEFVTDGPNPILPSNLTNLFILDADWAVANDAVKVQALDGNGQRRLIETDGLLAVCIQHEMDHLLGKVFVEYLSPLKRNRIKTKMLKAQREARS